MKSNSRTTADKWLLVSRRQIDSAKVKKANSDFYQQFIESFEELFTFKQTAKVISLSENLLEKHGGFLFEGVRLDAPKEWKKWIE